MINPAQYQQVLQKMPDQALMQLLKRPDKIPSQFVVQEINRRKQMRQAGQAQKQQVANAVAMQQQQPVQTTTPEGQPAIGMSSGGSGRLNPQGFFARPTSEIFADIFSGPIFGRRDSGKDKDIYEDNPMLSTKGSAKSNLDKTKNVFGRTMPDLVRASYMTGKGQYNPNFPSEKVMGIDTLRPPEDENLIDADDIGLKDQSIAKTVEDVNPDPKLVEKLDENNTATNNFANSLKSINEQLKNTNNKFGAEQLQIGIDSMLQFNELEQGFKDLDAKGKKRVSDFNKDSKDLLDERKKLIANLESGGRSPSSIVYESLINMGLNLMASSEANFTQALGKSGQAGFATFQNLRKEEKERVKDMHKMSYDLAVKEFDHKQKSDEIQNAYDIKVLDGKSVLLNAKIQQQEQQRKGQKTAADINYMGQQVRLGDMQNAIRYADLDIKEFNANINKFKVENDAIYKNMDISLRKEKIDRPTSMFENILFRMDDKGLSKEDALDKAIEMYVSTQASDTKDDNIRKDLIEKAIPSLFKTFDPDIARQDSEYTKNFIMQANEIIDSLDEAAGGSRTFQNSLDEIVKSIQGQK